MMREFNLYCDESCHLENDHQKVMLLGTIWCPTELARPFAEKIREIKTRHGLNPRFEAKWTKVSRGKQSFYLELLEFFFSDSDINFRGLIVPDKTVLDHAKFGQTHTEWYYKMYFDLLKQIIDLDSSYRIFVDIRDNHGGHRIRKLNEVLVNNCRDWDHRVIRNVQLVRSHEVELMQIADLLIGALAYINRGLTSNTGKIAFVNRFKELSRLSLTSSTSYTAKKVNILRWVSGECTR